MITFRKLGEYGRLGNQMFQIAATIGIARQNGVDYGFNKWEYESFFKRKLPVAIEGDIPILNEREFSYSSYEICPDMDYELQGYFQSERYWEDNIDEVLSYFEFAAPTAPYPSTTVSIHIRRGDYLRLSNYHKNLTIDYYERAMDRFPGCTFYVFSDDIVWSNQEFSKFSDKDIVIVTGNYGDPNHLAVSDLRLMSQCQHNIIANSSFSWWGAYLNKNPDKTVIVPKQWFGKDGPKNTQDLIPESWVRI